VELALGAKIDSGEVTAEEKEFLESLLQILYRVEVCQSSHNFSDWVDVQYSLRMALRPLMCKKTQVTKKKHSENSPSFNQYK
jgi:hypothetical protein